MRLLPGLFVIILMTSCGDMTEEYWLEEDGSGRAEFTMDMSGMMDFLIETITPDSVKEKKLKEPEVFDSTVTISKFVPDSLMGEYADRLSRVNLRFWGEAPNNFNATLGISFSSVSDYRTTIESLGELKDQLRDSTQQRTRRMIENLASFADKELQWEKGRFFRKGVTKAEMDAEAGEELNLDDPDERALMEEMLGESKLITIVHLPKKVCKVRPKTASKNRNDVEWSMPMIEMFENGVPDLTVKYKK